jgi:hypothetical protein
MHPLINNKCVCMPCSRINKCSLYVDHDCFNSHHSYIIHKHMILSHLILFNLRNWYAIFKWPHNRPKLNMWCCLAILCDCPIKETVLPTYWYTFRSDSTIPFTSHTVWRSCILVWWHKTGYYERGQVPGSEYHSGCVPENGSKRTEGCQSCSCTGSTPW